jgi:hypothetical protein
MAPQLDYFVLIFKTTLPLLGSRVAQAMLSDIFQHPGGENRVWSEP